MNILSTAVAIVGIVLAIETTGATWIAPAAATAAALAWAVVEARRRDYIDSTGLADLVDGARFLIAGIVILGVWFAWYVVGVRA